VILNGSLIPSQLLGRTVDLEGRGGVPPVKCVTGSHVRTCAGSVCEKDLRCDLTGGDVGVDKSLDS